MTTTTTGDTSSLKTPPTLSGGDLVSRLLAATPPYLYNVPLTPHSFFFSEMLRSFVQSKAEASGSPASSATSVARRRKRSWRDARDRPLELTTKDKTSHHSHHLAVQQQQKEKYYPIQPQQHSQSEIHAENRFKSHSETSGYSAESMIKRPASYEQKSSSYSITEPLKPLDENRTDFCKQARDFYDDSSRRFTGEQSAQEAIFAAQKVKPEETQLVQQTSTETKNDFSSSEVAKVSELSFLADQKNKLQEFAGRNFLPGISGLPRIEDPAKNFGLTNVPNGTDFMPSGPLWYPPYPTMAQSYPGIDPLHFFIDLRVSGHIWDRKMNERQLPFKSKHCSAFSVPQAKEYNRPLDLTRDEATTSSNAPRHSSHNNQRGTHFILRNLSETYKDIREMEKNDRSESISSASPDDNSSKDSQERSLPKNENSASTSSSREQRQPKGDENEGKDLRALIGLELVVDYVKEPKEDSLLEEKQSPDAGE